MNTVDGADQYVKTPNSYEYNGKMPKRDWTSAPSSHLFPRMWDSDNDRGQLQTYKEFGGVEEGSDVTFGNNITYFTRYQFGFMYMRYFLWNFAGKQNDVQGFGNPRDGNFITGISFIDNALFGDQSKMPNTIKSKNKANNTLFMLPLILGIIGFVFQYRKTKKDFLVTGLLFFFTGIAIVIYLNQQSLQPRERDYAYVGSFYAFAIWIGLGVLQIIEWLKSIMNQRIAAIVATVICFLAVPTLMAQQEWDDHDRSKKTLPLDMARDYLESCPPNAILFSFGDNDTYPLWYAQEVEGIRPDVRVVVNSLLGSDWYMRELRYKVNESNKFDVIFTEDQVAGNKLNYVLYAPQNTDAEKSYHNLDSVLRNVVANPTGKYTTPTDGGPMNIFPTHKLKVPVNKANAIAAGIASPTDSILDEMLIDVDPKRRHLVKNELAIYAIIATSQFKRPICFTSPQELGDLGLDKYVRLRGLAYELVPIKVENPVNTEVAYNTIMTKFAFGNAKNPNVYFDEENRRHLNSLRMSITQVAISLIMEGKKDKAKNLLRKLDSETNERSLPYGMTSNRGGNQDNRIAAEMLRACYLAEDYDLAKKISNSILKDVNQQLNYYRSLGEQMSEAQFSQNLEAAIQQKPSIFTEEYNKKYDKQISLIQDAASAFDVKSRVLRLAQEAGKK